MTGNTEKYSENKMDDKVDAGLKRPGKDQGKNPCYFIRSFTNGKT